VSQDEPSFSVKTDIVSKNVDVFVFIDELQSISDFDVDNLTAVARSLVDLDASADQWTSVWVNQKFLDFINTCAHHPPC